MKQLFTLILLLLCSCMCSSYKTSEGFDYSIVFGGCFTNEVVSLKINNKAVFEKYKVENGNPTKKGHLSLTQSPKEINLFYNGRQQVKSKINFDFILNLNIVINNKPSSLKVDLRKGKVVIINFCPTEKNNQQPKKLTIEQIQEPVILM